ncbi:hypothetical protein N7520_007906 [Penicillium odoratum]|uniref:uncharacterized protein n=1 Tax=Penicillium odoratum TaxID=1167516 RepID=UPI002547FCB3|nr:uncharacterized protein N7520_007906 [Penicillium odoratum]KAJ5760750.1 hypothetical protein N7520_007906 [Penicillium odoratum]
MLFFAVVENGWPPKSPRDAMLSSPGGRRKYQDMQRRQLLSSPLKRSNTTPNFRSKARQVLDEGEDDGEEDEETLELRLAEIQARLKLKQLQRSRGRSGTATSHTEDEEDSFGAAPRSQRRITAPRSPPPSQRKARIDQVQVPVSPTRRAAPAPEPWSPRRYQLGIDKGWKASDVSLKRPPAPRLEARPASQLGTRSGAMSRANDMYPPRPQTSPGGAGLNRIKSFSERMAEGRAAERAEQSRLEKVERVQANRSSAFQVDKAEIETLRAAVADEPQSTLPSSISREPETYAFNREEILRSLNRPQAGVLKRSQTTPNMRGTSEEVGSAQSAPDASKFESYSSLHLSSRILPHSFLSRTMTDKTVLRIPDLLKTIKAPAFELPDEIDGDFVVFGIVASKSEPRQKKASEQTTAKSADLYDDGLQNTNSYMAITLTDLKWTVNLLLFDTAFPRYYKITEGTLVAILNPTILPPPKHQQDTNRFSLCLSSSDDKILEIGKARDIGYCKSVKKDGKTCQSWVDGRKTEFCDFHVDLQVRRTQGQRSGVNSGTGQFGPGGRSGSRTGFYDGERRKHSRLGEPRKEGLRSEGGQYDIATGSTYFVAPAPRNRGAVRMSYDPMAAGCGTAALLDANDDPFIAAGMMGRGRENKEEQMRRRLAAQKRERDITQKLISGRVGGVGAEYLRTRTETPTTTETSCTPKAVPSTGSDFNVASFGRAKNVKLGPMKRAHDGDKPHGSGVKKTRFITAKGIREAGRDSLGGPETTGGQQRALSDDDDDDLEFV